MHGNGIVSGPIDRLIDWIHYRGAGQLANATVSASASHLGDEFVQDLPKFLFREGLQHESR